MSDSEATILIVDDDPGILASIADILRIGGYRCCTATNGVEALQAMQDQAPDLIVADIMMPEMDGYAFYQAVREVSRWASIPFIFLTARGQQKDIRHGYHLGADHYITKPFEPEDLLIAIQARLRRMAEIRADIEQEVERAKRHLLTVFEHELRTPLASVYGYLGLLQEGGEHLSPEDAEALLDGMRRGVDRLVKLVEDLMLLAYIDSGALQATIAHQSQPTGLGNRIQQAIQDLSDDAERRRVVISSAIEHNLTVMGVPTYLQDIFSRLIENAIKFSKRSGGRVWVRAVAHDGQAVVSVRDEGVGIAASDQKLLFDQFRQINREKYEQQGVGLGLAIAGQLAELHGGQIVVESEPEQGSTFTVYLPLVEG